MIIHIDDLNDGLPGYDAVPFVPIYQNVHHIQSDRKLENFIVYRTENLHPPGHPQTAAVLRDAINGTFCNGKKR